MKKLPFVILTKGSFTRSQIWLSWVDEVQNLPSNLTRKIDDYWNTEILPKKGEFVFNGQLARLINWSADAVSISFELGRTDYKTLLYSNFINRNHETHGDFNCNALGISVVIVSADNQLILMQRSQQVGECAGMIDVIGGHIEPGESDLDGIPHPFKAIEAEIEEEVGLKNYTAENLICIGLLETPQTRKPELIFRLNSELSSKQIIESAREKRTSEASDFFSIKNNKDDIRRLAEKNFEKFSPSAMGSLYLFADLN